MIEFRIVENLWGWSLTGVASWVRYGWGLFPRWSVQGGAPDGRDLQCCKFGPVAWSWPG